MKEEWEIWLLRIDVASPQKTWKMNTEAEIGGKSAKHYWEEHHSEVSYRSQEGHPGDKNIDKDDTL